MYYFIGRIFFFLSAYATILICECFYIPHILQTSHKIAAQRRTIASESANHVSSHGVNFNLLLSKRINILLFNQNQKSTDGYSKQFFSSKQKFRNSHGNEDRNIQVDKILLACRSLKPYVTLTELNHAITTAGRAGRINDALEIFRSMEKLDFTPDLMSYNNIIWCAGNQGRVELAKDLFTQLTTKTTLKPNVYTFGALMHSCARSRDFQRALVYLDLMDKLKIRPNLIVFTSAIEACSEAGKYKEALKIMGRMKALGMKPDLTMINAAIKACSLAGAIDEAEVLAGSLREFYSMDLFTYHTLMMGNTKLGRHYRVISLYEEALQSGALLDGGIFSLAMLSALHCGQYHLVPRIADKARSQGVRLTEASYTTLIQSYSEAGACDLAVKCLDQMVSEGLVPNVISYAAAMAASRDRPSVVLGLMNRMLAEGITPNTVLLTTAINSLARAPPINGEDCHSKKAYEILLDMEKNGPEPNIYTYNTVIRAFAEVGKLEEAMEILGNIKKRGLVPDQFTFTTLLIACGRSKCSDKVTSIMETMKNAGLMPDEIVYGAAIDAHRRANDSASAIACLGEMIKFKLEPSASHYNLVLRALRAQGDIQKMLKVSLSIIQKEDAKINSNTFEIVIEALLEANMWKQTLQLLNIMEKYGFKPQLQIYVTLVEQLEKARQYKAVLALYKVMSRDGYDFYENSVLNEVFKRLVSVAAKGVKADLSLSGDTFLSANPSVNLIDGEESFLSSLTFINKVENENESEIKSCDVKEVVKKGNVDINAGMLVAQALSHGSHSS